MFFERTLDSKAKYSQVYPPDGWEVYLQQLMCQRYLCCICEKCSKHSKTTSSTTNFPNVSRLAETGTGTSILACKWTRYNATVAKTPKTIFQLFTNWFNRGTAGFHFAKMCSLLIFHRDLDFWGKIQKLEPRSNNLQTWSLQSTLGSF